jgi:hypothetical protein
MSENAWAGGDGSDEAREIRSPAPMSLEAHIERQEAEMAVSGPTMAEWLARMHGLDWGTADSNAMIRDIREWRDREAG